MSRSTVLEPTPGVVDGKVRAAGSERSPATRVFTTTAAAYLAMTAVLGAAGWALMELSPDSWVQELDRSTTSWLARNRIGMIDAVSKNLSNLTDTFTVLGTLFGAGVVLLVLRFWRQAAVLLVALPLELLVFLSVNYFVDRARPAVNALESVPSTGSFPSGHVAAAIALYGGMAVVVRSVSVSERVNRWAVVVAVVIAAGVGLSRVYGGLHHPLDVVAGVALGLGSLYAAVLAARAVQSPATKNSQSPPAEIPTR